MFLRAFLLLSLLLHFCVFESLRAVNNDDPSEEFVAAYRSFKEAERLDQAGSREEAIAKYRYAENHLIDISNNYPNWQKPIVEFRLSKIRNNLARITASSSAAKSSADSDRSPAEHSSYQNNVPRSSAPESESLEAVSQGTSKGDIPTLSIIPPAVKTSPSNSNEVSQLQKKLKRTEADLEKTQRELVDKTVELDHSKVSLVETKAQLAKTERQLVDLKSDLEKNRAGSLKRESALKSSLQQLEEKVVALSADKEVMVEENSGLQQHLQRASNALTAALSNKNRLEELQVEVNVAKNASAALHEQLLAAQRERDEARAESTTLVQRMKQTSDSLMAAEKKGRDLVTLQTQVATLQQQLQQANGLLATSEKKIAALEQAGPEKDHLLQEKEREFVVARDEAAKFQKELLVAQHQLTSIQTEVKTKDDRYGELKKQLDQKNEEIAALQKKGTKKADEEIMIAENELLRGIVMRELKAEAKRQQLRTWIMEDLEKLKVKSDSLSLQLRKLAKPVRLTPEERALFKDKLPLAPDTEQDDDKLVVTVEASKNRLPSTLADANHVQGISGAQTQNMQEALDVPEAEKLQGSLRQAGPEGVRQAGASETNASTGMPQQVTAADSSSPSATLKTGSETQTNNVTSTNASVEVKKKEGENDVKKEILADQEKYHTAIDKAKEQFEHQHYAEAEKSFQDALTAAPNDYMTLSNLGVVEFQLGKMPEAESTLKRACTQDPKKSFAFTTLGIVHYRQERFDDAEKVLRQAVALNDQDFTAHNYLGIVLAASGRSKAGESEIMRSIELNPNYADAHFNLAVIYATGKPPTKDVAKLHYKRAVSLGAPPDQALERLIN